MILSQYVGQHGSSAIIYQAVNQEVTNYHIPHKLKLVVSTNYSFCVCLNILSVNLTVHGIHGILATFKPLQNIISHLSNSLMFLPPRVLSIQSCITSGKGPSTLVLHCKYIVCIPPGIIGVLTTLVIS